MKNGVSRGCVFLIGAAMLTGCGGSQGSLPSTSGSPVPKGSRVLAIDAFYGTTLPANLQAAQSVGAQSVTQLVTWTMIETSPTM